MGKSKRAKTQLKRTLISKFESCPWKCPRCFKRMKTEVVLIGYWKAKYARLPVPKLLLSARDGLKLKENRKVKKKSWQKF